MNRNFTVKNYDWSSNEYKNVDPNKKRKQNEN